MISYESAKKIYETIAWEEPELMPLVDWLFEILPLYKRKDVKVICDLLKNIKLGMLENYQKLSNMFMPEIMRDIYLTARRRNRSVSEILSDGMICFYNLVNRILKRDITLETIRDFKANIRETFFAEISRQINKDHNPYLPDDIMHTIERMKNVLAMNFLDPETDISTGRAMPILAREMGIAAERVENLIVYTLEQIPFEKLIECDYCKAGLIESDFTQDVTERIDAESLRRMVFEFLEPQELELLSAALGLEYAGKETYSQAIKRLGLTEQTARTLYLKILRKIRRKMRKQLVGLS